MQRLPLYSRPASLHTHILLYPSSRKQKSLTEFQKTFQPGGKGPGCKAEPARVGALEEVQKVPHRQDWRSVYLRPEVPHLTQDNQIQRQKQIPDIFSNICQPHVYPTKACKRTGTTLFCLGQTTPGILCPRRFFFSHSHWLGVKQESGIALSQLLSLLPAFSFQLTHLNFGFLVTRQFQLLICSLTQSLSLCYLYDPYLRGHYQEAGVAIPAIECFLDPGIRSDET